MGSQLVNLRIDRIIAHQVFKRTETRDIVPPKCSNELTQLDPSGLNTLQERIIGALGDDSHCIEMTIVNDGPDSVYQICSHLLESSEDTFKSLSNALVNKLARSQTSRRIPGGIVVIFTGLVGNEDHKYAGIIKAELHGGFSINEDDNTLLLQYLSDLLLTPQQKLYKIAMVIEINRTNNPELRTPDDFKVLVYDHNMTRTETRQAAQYFYESFLGCTFSPSNKKLTSDFYYNTKEFISSIEQDDETKLDLNTSLYTYLKVSQSNVIKLSEFADQYLQPEFRDNYQNFMTARGLPAHAVTKDLTYLRHKLRRRSLRFTSKVKISAPSDHFDELVNIRGRENSKTIVAIEGQVERED